MAVDPALQGTGLGHRLTDAAIARAAERGITSLYLPTMTAERFFPKFGFEQIRRDEVPDSLKASVEFQSACPASAIVMRRIAASR